MPFSPGLMLIFIFLLTALVTFVQIGALTIAFEKLGLSSESAFTLLFSSLLGSMINLPLFKVDASAPSPHQAPASLQGLLRQRLQEFKGKTVIAINVGGCLIPLTFSLYLLHNNPVTITQTVLGITIVAAISWVFSRPVPGLGIGMPIFVAPVSAAIVATLLNANESAALAYICGTLGVLIGADLLRLKDIQKMGAPVASIGGAGTFDGIFITGIVAVLIA